jgi:PhnB protein
LIPKAGTRGFHAAMETAMYVPEGFATVMPYIFASGADQYVRFLAAAFGAHEIGRSTVPGGRIANCQMRFDTATIMVSEASEQFPAGAAAFYLYVAGANAAMAIAEAAG